MLGIRTIPHWSNVCRYDIRVVLEKESRDCLGSEKYAYSTHLERTDSIECRAHCEMMVSFKVTDSGPEVSVQYTPVLTIYSRLEQKCYGN